MAIEYSTVVWQASPYKAEKLLAMLALADWANDEGEFYPSESEIAKKARLTERGAIGVIGQMIEDGEIELVEKGGGRGHRNRYRFAAHYREAVAELRQTWATKRAKKQPRNTESQTVNGAPNSEAGSGNAEAQTLNEDAQTLNEDAINPERDCIAYKEEPSCIRHEPVVVSTTAATGKDEQQGEQKTQTQPAAAPPSPASSTPVEIYQRVSGRTLSIAEQELVETAIPQTETAQFETFLRGWSATYGTKGVFKVLKAYAEQRTDPSKQKRSVFDLGKSTLGGWQGPTPVALTPAVAHPVKPIQPAVAGGDGSGSAERLAGGAGSDPDSPMARALSVRARIAASRAATEDLKRRRPDLFPPKAPKRNEVECPF